MKFSRSVREDVSVVSTPKVYEFEVRCSSVSGNEFCESFVSISLICVLVSVSDRLANGSVER